MRIAKRYFRALFISLAAAALLTAAGCNKGGGEAVEPGPVTLIVRTGVEADGLKKVAEQFTNKTGIQVDVREEGRSGYEGKVKTILLGRRPDFDAVFFQSTFVPEFAEAGVISPLDEFAANGDWTDAADFDRDDLLASYSYKGKLYALPTDVSTHFLYYRSDLISSPPETWEEYMETARNFTKSLNPDSPTIFGAAMSGRAPEELPKVFYSLMWSMGGNLIGPEGKAGLREAGAIRAGRYYRKLAEEKLVTPEILSWGFPEVKKALQTGEVAMAAPFWNAAYGLILSEEGPFRDKIAVAAVPGERQTDGSILRTPFQHGWTLVMNASSKNKENAWRFIAYATGKEGGRIHALAGGSPGRRSILSDPELQKARPDFALMLESLEAARAEPPVVFYTQMHEAMNAALTEILRRGKSPRQALGEAADSINRLIDENG